VTTTERILATIGENPGISYRELWRRMAPLGRTVIDPILREHLGRGEIAASIDAADRDASTFRLASVEGSGASLADVAFGMGDRERLARARHRREVKGGAPARFPDPREGMTR
jgi:hypothetical protein